jgi:hypothetical protein
MEGLAGLDPSVAEEDDGSSGFSKVFVPSGTNGNRLHSPLLCLPVQGI